MSFPTSKAQVVHSSASHKGEAQALVTFLLRWEDHPSGRKWLIPMVAYCPLTRVVPLPNGLDGLEMGVKQ